MKTQLYNLPVLDAAPEPDILSLNLLRAEANAIYHNHHIRAVQFWTKAQKAEQRSQLRNPNQNK